MHLPSYVCSTKIYTASQASSSSLFWPLLTRVALQRLRMETVCRTISKLVINAGMNATLSGHASAVNDPLKYHLKCVIYIEWNYLL